MKTALWVCGLIIAAMIGVSIYGWMHIPENTMIARHWNLSGVADGFSPRNHVLIGMPVFAAAIAFFFFLIPAIDPRPDHVRRSAGLLTASVIGVTALLAVTHASIVLPAARGAASPPLPGATLYAASILLILVGNYTAKSRSNFFLGIRTPWTLTSEHAWSVANRTGGWLFALTGAAAAAAGFIGGPRAISCSASAPSPQRSLASSFPILPGAATRNAEPPDCRLPHISNTAPKVREIQPPYLTLGTSTPKSTLALA